MSNLSNEIEEYLKHLLEENRLGTIEIQRSILSQYFDCVPSQINYVLSTRFTPARGYIVETRRGGGGYVRIVSIQAEQHSEVWQQLMEAVGSKVNESEAEGMCQYLLQQGFLSKREVMLVSSMLKDRVLSLQSQHRDVLRAKMLQQLLATLGRGDL